MPRTLALSLVFIPLLLGGAARDEPSRKDVLRLSVHCDSGAATRFTLLSKGFVVFPDRPRQDSLLTAPATITLLGVGAAVIATADSGRLVIAEVQITTVDTTITRRVAVRSLRIDRSSVTTPFYLTER
jgi:hypothetical protein